MDPAPSINWDEEKENIIRRSEPSIEIFLQNHLKVL